MRKTHYRYIGLISAMIFSSAAYAGALRSSTPRIVGGTQVSDQSTVPFIVQLHDSNGVECGGTVIAAQWVLSAGHCSEVVDGITILAGSLVSGDGTALKVKNHFVHPQYTTSSQGVPSYDFMLIQLDKPIDFANSNIQAIALPDADFVSRGMQNTGAVMTVAGWGDLGENAGNYPSQLNEVNVPIVDQTLANAAASYNGQLDDTMLAAGFPGGGHDSCDGDSGGPLFTFDTAKNQNVLVGAVSWGQGCAEANYYGIYSKVSVATPWIAQTMQANP